MSLLAAAVLVVCGLLATPAFARVHHNDAWARQEFAKAERMREALNGRPAKQRTRREYQHAIDAYRRVYFGRPASPKADPSVVATAELMVEMGRRFDDDKILRGAIEEYRFLRKEYPGSRYRYEALFTIGEIYKDDLNDSEQARKTFEDFLHKYPRNQLADDARDAVKELDDAAKAENETTAHKGRTGEAGKAASSVDAKGAVNSGADARRNSLPRVTGVRHWSTPDYTRVAIDVEQEVKFNSQRVANPDRILFDIADAKLASTLVGKTFDVDDGFLKKIHVAETKPGQTQLVLEVDDLASYNAFLLPDPYRLIIDIHGKQNRSAETAKARGETALAAAAVATELEAGSSTAGKSGKEQPRPTRATAKNADNAKATTTEDAEAQDASSEASDGTGSRNGIVKTTVTVKGTDRRIPKTIVGPDDDAAATAKTARRRRGGSVVNRTETGKAAGTTAAADEGTEQAKLTKPDELDSAEAREGPTVIESKTAPEAEQKTSLKGMQRKKSRTAAAAALDTADLEAREARPTAAGNRSLTRALGLKIGKIVIDAGHGGHDTGTIGPDGLLEKDLVLDVAKRLGKLLEARLGAEVIYTRRDDTFIPLETRTAIANRERADLFISIHANSSRDEDARGVETYYLNFTSSPEALEVAARENAVSEKSVYELQDLVKKIALKDKIDESREFASDVQDSLYGGLSLGSAGVRNRGVKKAPFIVLIGANMPSILAEISFVSNPTDERKLETAEHRQRIAEALYHGVSKYAGGLSGVKVASKVEKTEGQ